MSPISRSPTPTSSSPTSAATSASPLAEHPRRAFPPPAAPTPPRAHNPRTAASTPSTRSRASSHASFARGAAPAPGAPHVIEISRREPSDSTQRGGADEDDDDGGDGDGEGNSPRSDADAGTGAEEGKKKRTRTLTTPYQSAVLHALLAQSRFPTTQMREEVGRTIGLSARKVQIWFQNQRQKAKRSASMSSQVAPSISTTPGPGPSSIPAASGPSAASGSLRPPQYGPYPPSSTSSSTHTPAPAHPHAHTLPPTHAPLRPSPVNASTAVALDPGFGGSIGLMFSSSSGSGGLFGSSSGASGSRPSGSSSRPATSSSSRYKHSHAQDPYPHPQLSGPGMPGASTLPIPMPMPLGGSGQLPPLFEGRARAASASAVHRGQHGRPPPSRWSRWRPGSGVSTPGPVGGGADGAGPSGDAQSRSSSVSPGDGYAAALPPLVIDSASGRPTPAFAAEERRSTSSAPSAYRPGTASSYAPSSASVSSVELAQLSLGPGPTSVLLAPIPPRADSPFAHTLPELSPGADDASNTIGPSSTGTSARLGIPPPFALEPQPQWDPASFSPFASLAAQRNRSLDSGFASGPTPAPAQGVPPALYAPAPTQAPVRPRPVRHGSAGEGGAWRSKHPSHASAYSDPYAYSSGSRAADAASVRSSASGSPEQTRGAHDVREPDPVHGHGRARTRAGWFDPVRGASDRPRRAKFRAGEDADDADDGDDDDHAMALDENV